MLKCTSGTEHTLPRSPLWRSFQHYWGKLVIEGSSYLGAILLCVSPWLNCREQWQEGSRLEVSEVWEPWVCIQALINSLLLPLRLAFLPSWGTCQLHGWCVFMHVCVYIYVCVFASTIISLSPPFVPVLTHHPPPYPPSPLPSCVRFCEASRSHRMEHNYPLLAVNPCPPNKSFLRLYP